jgi:hypothetical protein
MTLVIWVLRHELTLFIDDDIIDTQLHWAQQVVLHQWNVNCLVND